VGEIALDNDVLPLVNIFIRSKDIRGESRKLS